MKKEYNSWENRHNIPNLDLYTRLQGMFYGFLGVNYLLVFFYARFVLKFKNNIMILFLSMLFLWSGIDKKNDSRKGERELGSVIGDGIIYSIGTLIVVFLAYSWWLLVIFISQLISIIIVIWNYFNQE